MGLVVVHLEVSQRQRAHMGVLESAKGFGEDLGKSDLGGRYLLHWEQHSQQGNSSHESVGAWGRKRRAKAMGKLWLGPRGPAYLLSSCG